MKLKNRIKYAGMAAALALSLTTPTFAAGLTPDNNPNNPHDYTQSAKGGDTIISVYETRINTGNLSVEVPLYLTLAVVAEDNAATPILVPPTNYYIKNTSTDGKGGRAAYPIGVTAVNIDTLDTNTWTLRTYDGGDAYKGAGNAGGGKEMTLNFTAKTWSWDNANAVWVQGAAASFGFPAITKGQSKKITTNNYDMDNDGAWSAAKDANLFASTQANNFNPIPSGEKLEIEIDGGVNGGYTVQDADLSGTAAKPAVPQFRVTYTVSALDKTTLEPIGAPYAGDIFGPAPNHGLLDQNGFNNGDYDSNFDDKSNPK